MPTISTYVDVDIDVDLDEFGDDELVEELESRGYFCSKESIDDIEFDKYDWDLLLDLVDKAEQNIYTYRVRDKLMNQRWGPK